MEEQGSTPSIIAGSQDSKSLSAPFAASPSPAPSPAQPSLLRQLIDGGLVVAVMATIVSHLPWCLTMYERGDRWPLGASVVTLFLLAARASPQDVVNLAMRILPSRSGGGEK